MANEKFRVKYGLAVGDNTTQTAMSVDGTTGDIVTAGDIQLGGNNIKSSSTNSAITLNDVNVKVDGELTVTGNRIRSSGGTAFPLGDIAVQLSGSNVEVVGDLTVTGNDIKGSGGTTAITMTGADVAVAGDLTVTGNDIKSSSATAITLSGSDTTFNGDITVNGNDIKSSGGTTAITLSGTDVTVAGDLTVNGNDIKSFGGSTAITLSTTNVDVAGNLTVTGGNIRSATNQVIGLVGADAIISGDLTVTGNDIKSSTATAITLSNTSVTVAGDLGVNGGDITTNQTTATVFNATATTLNIGGAATTVSIGANTGTTTINNSLVADDISILTVDATNIEVTNIKAKDGTAAMTIADTTGAVTVTTSLQVDNIDIRDNTISSTNTNGAINLTPNGTGVVVIPTADVTNLDVTNIRALDGTAAATIANSTGAVTVSTELTVDNININGNTVISTDTNGNITLDPNGTGNVALTLADGGNLTNTRNYLFGPVRNASTLARGNIWELLSTGAGTAPYRGFSADNGTDITKQSMLLLRNYGATAGNRSRVLFERSRGTAAAPSRVQSGDLLGEVDATGYSDTGWLNDQVAAVPGFFGFTATENWTGTSNCGTGFVLSLQPTGTLLAGGAQTPVIVANPQSVIFRTDAYSFRTRAGTTAAGDYLSLASTGAIIKNGSNVELANFATGTATISADNIVLQKSNGTDLLQIDSDNATLTTTRLRQVSSGTYGGEIVLKAGILTGATAYDKSTELGVTANTTDGTNQAAFEVKTNRFDGTNYSPTVSGDGLGQFKFNGNYSSGTSPAVNAPAAALECQATENWTASANGALIALSAIKAGTTSIQQVARYSPEQSILFTDAYQIKDSNNVLLPGGKIDYERIHGCFHKIATVLGTDFTADTVYEFNWFTDTTAHVGNQGVTVTSGNPTRVNIDTAGRYTATVEMQAANTDNADRFAYIWLAKNGTDIAETRITVKLQKENEQVITKVWLLENIAANDYIELRFAVDNTSGISLNYEAAQTTPFVMPAQPSATLTIVPVGA